MKKTISFILAFTLTLTVALAQSFRDDFESYKVSDYLGDVSSDWTTWSGSTGGKEDIQIVDNDAFSGTQSIYYDSPFGNGPQDIVLPFGGVHNTGKFKFTSMFKIPKGNAAYFNFQGGAAIGSSWAFEFYMYDNGTWSVNKLSGGYPQDQWFEVKVEVNFATNRWEVFIDGVSMGITSSGVNAVSYLDIFGTDPNSSFWVDDVSYCFNNACNTDVEMTSVAITPNPLCSNHKADVTLDIKNNGPFVATGFLLGLDVPGQSRISYTVNLNNLAMGNDTTITISNLFKTNFLGTLSVNAINVDHDMNIKNDTAKTSVKVVASPSGATIIKGSPFQGVFNIGIESQPDITEINKTSKYELTPPKGYSNSNYASSWFISSIIARTTYGVVVPASAYTVVYPSSGVNGSITFTGSSSYLDSNITFSVSIINLPNNCDSVVKRTIRVVPTPKPDFSFPSAVCLGDFTAFNNKTSLHSGQASYTWYFGDGDSSDNTSPIHEYKTAGTYMVRLVAKSFPYGIIKDTSISVVVGEIPLVKFKSNNKCQGVAVDFQNQSTVGNGIMTYDWDFGDGSAHSTIGNPSHLYATPGVYKVRLTASANGCPATVIKTAYMFARPVPGFTTPSGPVCSGTSLLLSNTSTILLGNQGAQWSYGDGTISTLMDGKHIYANEGTYNVQLMAVSEFGCKDSLTKQVIIKPSPKPDFRGDKFCSNVNTVFTNTTVEAIPNPTYNWTFSDNFSSSQKNVTRSWSSEGQLSATLKADYTNGCSGQVTKDFEVLLQPKADFSVRDICSGEIANFVNLSKGEKGNIDFKWDFGNGTGTDPSPKRLYNPTVTTTYTVLLSASYSFGCSDTIVKTITVSQAPVCDFSVKNQGFLKYQFTPSNTGYTKYEWFFGEGGTSETTTPLYEFAYASIFHVKMVATNSAGCKCETTKTIQTTSSVKDLSANTGLSIYPNPNSGVFTIASTGNNGMKIEVFNLLGSKILSQATTENKVNVNMGDVSKGIYLVKVTVDGVTTTSKITVAN